MSPKEKPATTISPEKPWSTKESWRLFGIMAEFVKGTERLNAIQSAFLAALAHNRIIFTIDWPDKLPGNYLNQHQQNMKSNSICNRLSLFQIKCAYCILFCQEPTCIK